MLLSNMGSTKGLQRVKLYFLQKYPNYAGWRLMEDLAGVI